MPGIPPGPGGGLAGWYATDHLAKSHSGVELFGGSAAPEWPVASR